MPRSTVAAWAQGMGRFRPVLETPSPGYLSFVNLTEAFVLHALRRRYKIEMSKIRRAIGYVEKQMGEEHPLAFKNFQTDYVDLFVRTAGGTINVSRGGQVRFDDDIGELDRIEWRKDRPIALFPIVRRGDIIDRRPIRISPLIAFGKPVIAGTRIPIAAVLGRWYAGEPFEDLAADFGVPAALVEEAVRAETEPAA